MPFYIADYGIGYVYWQAQQTVLVLMNIMPVMQTVTLVDLKLDNLPEWLRQAIQQTVVGCTLESTACQIIENFTRNLHNVDSE